MFFIPPYFHISQHRNRLPDTINVKIDLDDLLEQIEKKVEEKKKIEHDSEVWRQEEERKTIEFLRKMGIKE